jgi:chromate transport protein ChrA
VVLPSVIIILLIASVASRVLTHWATKSALLGAKPAVVGLLGVAAFSLSGKTLFQGEGELNLVAFILAFALFALSKWLKLSAIPLILSGAATGLLLQLCGISF